MKGDVIQLLCYQYFLLVLLIWRWFVMCLHIIDHFVMQRREEGYLISLFPHSPSHFSGVTSDIAGIQSSRVSSCIYEDGRQRNLFRRNTDLGPGNIFDGRKQEM